MKIVLEAPHRLVLTDGPAPTAPAPGQATVRVLRVGVCGTDLHAFQGEQAFLAYPRVLGHELAVEVTQLGAPHDSIRVGDRCTVLPYLSDGTCSACRRGRENCCENLAVLGVHVDGGMCSALNVPVTHLLPANDLPVDAVALVEMLSIGAHAVRRAALKGDDDVLVIGAGPIGLGALAFARLHARRCVVLDRSRTRIAFARSHAAAVGLEPGDDATSAVRDGFGGELPTVVFDATGNAASMERAAELVAHGGTLVFIGHTKGTLTFENQLLHRRELSALFSRNATRDDFETVLAALRNGTVDVMPWITHRAGPARLVRDLPNWLDPEFGVVKAMLEVA